MKKNKLFFILLSCVVCLLILPVGCGNKTSGEGNTNIESDNTNIKENFVDDEEEVSPNKEIFLPFDADILIGAGFNSVKKELEEIGFKKIQGIEISDLKNRDGDGCISEISIDGITDFTTESKFDENAEVFITYHTIEKEFLPFANSDVKGESYIEIVRELEHCGFNNIVINQVDDEERDNKKDGEIESIAVNTDQDFDNKKEYPIDTEIEVNYSNKMNKLTVKLSCIGNFIFNQYDVDVYLNDEYLGTVYHGEEDEFDTYVDDGKYILKFVGDDDDMPTGEEKIKINGDKTVRYEINCKSDKVETELIPGLKIPYTNSDLGNIKNKKVRESFEEAGYLDITTVPLSDLSKKQEDDLYKVSKITIDGKKNFSEKSNVYRDSKIKIYYHSAEKITMPYDYHDLETLTVNTAVKKLKQAGFTNVKKKKYDGRYPSDAKNGEIKKIDIGGETRFFEGDEYPWNSKIVIYYYSIEYKKYTAGQLIKELASNAYSASEKHTGEYVTVSGEISAIDTRGRGFALVSNDNWSIQQIDCVNLKDDDKERLLKLSVGSSVKVKGKITDVDSFSYTIETHEII